MVQHTLFSPLNARQGVGGTEAAVSWGMEGPSAIPAPGRPGLWPLPSRGPPLVLSTHSPSLTSPGWTPSPDPAGTAPETRSVEGLLQACRP